MYTDNYPKRQSFEPYVNEDQTYLVFLNEKKVKYSLPTEDPETEPIEIEGYSYTGTEPNGGTIIKAAEASYDAFVAGLIRLEYSADKVEAINANYRKAQRNPEDENAERYLKDDEEYEAYRMKCKEMARDLLER